MRLAPASANIRGVSMADRSIIAACAAVLARTRSRQARAPEADQPRRDARQVGGTDRQRPERIDEPARRLAQDAGRGERQYVRERERAGVAAAGLRRDALAVDQQHDPAILLQAQRDRDTDDARADHQHVARGLAGRQRWHVAYAKPHANASAGSKITFASSVTNARPWMNGSTAFAGTPGSVVAGRA